MMLKNREEAAVRLLEKLNHYQGKNPLVLGIPRGAVPMASHIAKGLSGELGVVLVHKIPSPENEEFAIGAIGLSGHIQRMPYLKEYHISESYIKAAAEKQLATLKARQQKYGLKDQNYKDRIVIIVDDGIATGATTLSAIEEVRTQDPEKIIVAAAVASRESVNKILPLVDEMVLLDIPSYFGAVGQFFENFTQVSDEEVIHLLSSSQD